MPLVGQTVNIVERPPDPNTPPSTAVWFVAGQCAKGSITTPIKVTSMAEYEALCGPRSGGITLYDAVDLFFAEGGQTCYVLRVVGTAPVTASLNLYDASGSLAGDVSLAVTAKSPGAWANTMTVEVTDGDDVNSFRLLVRNTADASVVENSPSLASIDAAVLWSQQTSQYINLAAGPSADPRPRTAVAASLASGTDDAGTIADSHWQAALDRAGADYGPGQVSIPGRTTLTGQTQLLQHAKDKNRFALIDLANTGTVATLVAAALSLRALTNKLPRFGMIAGPWVTAPGVNGAASTRTIPGCALYAALIARLEASGKMPNVPAAGANGIARYALGPAQTFTDAQFDTLYSAGINTALVKAGAFRIYGFRTLVDSVTDSNWVIAANGRLVMAIKARAAIIAEGFVLAEIDARGQIFKKFEGQLIAMLDPYKVAGSLAEYVVDTTSVNTPTTIANRQVNASIDLTIAGMAEKVTVNISKSPIA